MMRRYCLRQATGEKPAKINEIFIVHPLPAAQICLEWKLVVFLLQTIFYLRRFISRGEPHTGQTRIVLPKVFPISQKRVNHASSRLLWYWTMTLLPHLQNLSCMTDSCFVYLFELKSAYPVLPCHVTDSINHSTTQVSI